MAKKESHFGIVPSQFSATDVECLGSETELASCQMKKVTNIDLYIYAFSLGGFSKINL